MVGDFDLEDWNVLCTVSSILPELSYTTYKLSEANLVTFYRCSGCRVSRTYCSIGNSFLSSYESLLAVAVTHFKRDCITNFLLVK